MKKILIVMLIVVLIIAFGYAISGSRYSSEAEALGDFTAEIDFENPEIDAAIDTLYVNAHQAFLVVYARLDTISRQDEKDWELWDRMKKTALVGCVKLRHEYPNQEGVVKFANYIQDLKIACFTSGSTPHKISIMMGIAFRFLGDPVATKKCTAVFPEGNVWHFLDSGRIDDILREYDFTRAEPVT